MLTTDMLSFFSERCKQRADEKYNLGLEKVRRQARVPKEVTNKSRELKQEALSSTRNPRTNPPAPGWKSKYVEETEGNFAHHWISPTRNIEFLRPKQARELESLRSKHGSDEIQAWEEFRKMKRGQDTRVVNPCQYDLPNSEKGVTNIDSCKQSRQRGTTHITNLRTPLRARSLLMFNDGVGK
jgi:hypothetical protein